MRKTLTTGLLAACTLPALAQPIDPNAASQFNWNQTTGLVNIPIARSLPRGAFYGAFDFKAKHFQDLFGSEFLGGSGDKGNGSFHLMFSPIKNVEIGIMGLHDVNRGGNVNTFDRLLRVPPADSFSTAIKWVVAEETKDMPSIAVGVENLTYPYPYLNAGNGRFVQESLRYPGLKDKGFYAVASKSIPVGDQLLSLHLGAGTGRFNNRPFGGLEYTFDNGFTLLGEYDGYQGTYGMRYTGLRNFRVTAAMQGGQPTFQLGFILNPFDLIGTGDQKDYDPFARPGRDNSTEGFKKDLPPEEETQPKELPPPLPQEEKKPETSAAPPNPAQPPLSLAIQPEPKLTSSSSSSRATSDDDDFLIRPKKKPGASRKAGQRAPVVRHAVDEDAREFGRAENLGSSEPKVPTDDF